MSKCKICNAKGSQKIPITDGLCAGCLMKRNESEEVELIDTFVTEKADVGSQQFWVQMKKLLDVKFGNFQKTMETSLHQKIMCEVKAFVETESKCLKEDIETLKEENVEQQTKIRLLEKTVDELKSSIEMTDLVVRENKTGNEQKHLANAAEVTEMKKEQKERLDEAEDRSRRNNIRIGGLPEDEGESWEDTKKKMKAFFKESLKIDKDIVIQRAHRNKSDRRENNDRCPRVAVALLLNYEDKELIFQQAKLLKGTKYYISNDYCKNTVEIHKKLWNDVKNLRKENKRAFLGYRRIEIKNFS